MVHLLFMALKICIIHLVPAVVMFASNIHVPKYLGRLSSSRLIRGSLFSWWLYCLWCLVYLHADTNRL